MDQPTSLEITIRGKEEDVKRAALAAQKRIDRDTMGFKESAYTYGDGSDFESKIDAVVGILGRYNYNDNGDGTAEYYVDQESYGCTEEDDIKEIANNVIDISQNLEVHISAVITVTEEEGYDLCVDIDYEDGKMNIDCYEDYYEDWEEDNE